MPIHQAHSHTVTTFSIMNGKDIIITKKVSNDYVAIAATKSNEVQVDCDIIEIASPTTGAWRTRIAGRKDWSLNVSYLVTAGTGITDLLQVGNTFTLRIQDSDGTNHVDGEAILKVAKQTASIGNLVQGSFQFQGNGALT